MVWYPPSTFGDNEDLISDWDSKACGVFSFWVILDKSESANLVHQKLSQQKIPGSVKK